MICVIATVEVHPGRREAFLTEFHRLVPKVRAENGCIEYGPAVDVKPELPRQVPYRENTVTILEKWKDTDCLKVHLAAPHMGEYRAKVKDFVASVSLQVLQPA